MNTNLFSNYEKHGKFICSFIKVIIVLLFLCLGYLYVLNGRYSHIGSFCYFDKWTKRILIVNPEK